VLRGRIYLKSKQMLWPAVIFLPALVLRVLYLPSRGIWYDDAFSIFLSRQSLGRIVAGTAADTMPPLYYFLLHYWMDLFGQSLVALRSLNVLISLGIVALVWRLASSLIDSKAGIWAAIFAAVSSFQVYHAQELRMYALLALCSLGYVTFFSRIYFTSRASLKRKIYDWSGLVLCATAAMYTHNLAVFTLAAPGVFLALKRRWGQLLRLAGAGVIVALLSLPWLMKVPAQVAKIERAFWTLRPGVVDILQGLIEAHANLPLPPALLSIAAFITLLLVTLTAWEALRNRWRDDGFLLLATLALIPPFLLFIASYLMRSIFAPRAFMPSMLAYYLLLSRVVSQARVRAVGWIAGGAFVALSLASLPALYRFDSFPRSPFQPAMASLAERVTASDRVVHENKLSYFPSAYYAPGIAQTFLPDPPGSHNDTLAPATQAAVGIFPAVDLPSVVGDAKRVFFVVFREAIEEYKSTGQANDPALTWLEERFTLADRQVFNDLEIYTFVRGP